MRWEVPDNLVNDCSRKSQSREVFDLTFGMIQSGPSDEKRNGENGQCTDPAVCLFPPFQIFSKI